MNRALPHDIKAEQACLGAALLSNEASEGIVTDLLAEDFYRPAHARVFTAISTLVASGVRVDAVTVADRLGDELEAAGGPGYLLDLSSSAPTSSGWRRYAEIVRRFSMCRQIVTAGTQIATLGYDAPDDADGALADAEGMLESVRSGATTAHRSIGEVIDEVAKDSVEPSTYITLPVVDVRLRPGEVCILAARPKVGKTSLMAQMAHDLADRHLRCVLYNYEMSNEELASRYIATFGGISRKFLDDGIGPGGVDYVAQQTAGHWREFLFTVDRGMPLPALCADIRRSARRGARIAFIDYLGLVVDGSSYEEVTRASRMFKLTAKAARIPIVVISQFKRLEPGQEPSTTHLRQSGAIEQDADVVVLMHSYEPPESSEQAVKQRGDYRSRGYLLEMDDRRRLGYLKVALHRSGPTYTVPAFYDGADFYWSALDRTADGSGV